jgi:hypothetical protein
MFYLIEKSIFWMALLRIFSGSLEIFVALLILKFNDVEKALVVNSSLALVGPIILIITTSIGLLGMAEKVSLVKLVWILGGVVCIFYGVRSN